MYISLDPPDKSCFVLFFFLRLIENAIAHQVFFHISVAVVLAKKSTNLRYTLTNIGLFVQLFESSRSCFLKILRVKYPRIFLMIFLDTSLET